MSVLFKKTTEKQEYFGNMRVYSQFARPISRSSMWKTILSLNNRIGRHTFLESVLLKMWPRYGHLEPEEILVIT